MANRLEVPLLHLSVWWRAALDKYLLINNKRVNAKFWSLPMKSQAPSYMCWLNLSQSHTPFIIRPGHEASSTFTSETTILLEHPMPRLPSHACHWGTGERHPAHTPTPEVPGAWKTQRLGPGEDLVDYSPTSLPIWFCNLQRLSQRGWWVNESAWGRGGRAALSVNLGSHSTAATATFS